NYYARAGVRGVSCLVFGQYSLWAYGVNLEAFARGAVFPTAAAGARGAHAARFGRAAEPVVRYLAALERVMAEVVTYGDVLLPPAEAARAAAGARATPLAGGGAGRARRRGAPPRIHVRRPGGPRALARRGRSGGPRRRARRPGRRGPPRARGRSRPRRHLGPLRPRDHAPLLRGRARPT